eukprot:Pgem_evm1s3087
MSNTLKYVLFLGSTRTKRIGPKVAEQIVTRLQRRNPNAEITIVDPRNHENGFFMRLMEKPLFHYKDAEKKDIPEALIRT